MYIGLKSINYSDKLEPTKVYGAAAEPIGRTRGAYSAEGSFELYLDEFNSLVAALGTGYKLKPLLITVSYSEGDRTYTDTLEGARIKGVDASQAQGADPLVRKCDLDLMRVLWDGVSSVDRGLTEVAQVING